MTTPATDRRRQQRYEVHLIGSPCNDAVGLNRALNGLPAQFDRGVVARGLSCGGAPIAQATSVAELEPLQRHLWDCGIRVLIRAQPDRRHPQALRSRLSLKVRGWFGLVELPAGQEARHA